MKNSSFYEYSGYAMSTGGGVTREIVPEVKLHPIAANENAPVVRVPVQVVFPASDATTQQPGIYMSAGKRLLDIALVVASLPVTVPVILFCALVLWFEGGQPFYRQKRLGRGRREFRILKLRTMTVDAEECLQQCLDGDPALQAEWNATQKLKADPRVTRFGAVLRSTSLDELPQIWNVLKGEMSLVGPRPMFAEQLALYGAPAADRSYFPMRPGLSGAWQVSTRNHDGFARRAVYDAEYRKNVSLWTDVKIIFRTIGVVLRRTGY